MMEEPMSLVLRETSSEQEEVVSMKNVLESSDKVRNYKMGYMVLMPLIVWSVLFTFGQMVLAVWETGFFNNVRLLAVNVILITISVFIAISIHNMWKMFIEDVDWSKNTLSVMNDKNHGLDLVSLVKEYKSLYAGKLLAELTVQSWLLVLLMIPMMLMSGVALKGLWVVSAALGAPVLLFSYMEYQRAKEISQRLESKSPISGNLGVSGDSHE